MLVKRFVLIATGVLPAAFAQTTSTCNPLKGCFKDDPALGGSYSWDYSSSKAEAPQFDITSSSNRIYYESDGMHMRVAGTGDSPTLQSQFYIFWGRTEIVMKAGPGAGVVSSLVLQSDDLDEIDVEFIGNQPNNIQTNIFSKGNQDVHIYGANNGVNDAVNTFHSYVIDWTTDAINWYIDGTVIRTLTRASLGDVYPQTPMQIKFGPWAGGDPANAPGTIEWAGGAIDYSQGPFDMVIKSISITDYSTGATKYRYKDSSGSSGSIEIVGGGSQSVATTHTTAAPTTTKAATTSSPDPTTSSPDPTTSSTTSEEPTTSSTSTSSSTTTSSKSTSTSTSEKETTSEKSTKTSTSVSKSTFVVETTPTKASSSRTGSSTTNTATASTNERVATTETVPNSGSSVRAASPLVIALAALFLLF